MSNSKRKAQKLWKQIYGNQKLVKDFSGNFMHYDDYGKRNSSRKVNGVDTNCGWNLDHVLPKSKGGQNEAKNLMCTNIFTNQAKANKVTFWINGSKYHIRKINGRYVNARV